MSSQVLLRRVAGILPLVVLLSSFAAAEEEGFVSLWDGKSLENWKASENKDAWKIEDGAIIAHGPRSHLFYTGPEAPFKNFELRIDVKTTRGGNGGIFFHTQYQEAGWPKYGFEAQVNATHGDPKKSGSLYAVVDVKKAEHADDEWYTQTIRVEGNKVTLKTNDKTTVEYVEPEDKKPGADFTRKLDQGTIALQAHDPQSRIYYKNIRIKKLD
jgi:hypothetical protein